MRSSLLARAVASVAALAAVAAITAPSASASVDPDGAVRVGAAAADRELSLMLGLRRDDAGLARFVDRVSDPASPSYGRYLDVPEIARRFGAPPAARRATLRWLRAQGLRGRVSATGGWVDVTVRARTAERLFGTRLAAFRASDGDRFVAPLREPRVPAALRGAVTEVVGLDDGRRVSANAVHRPEYVPTPHDREVDRLARERGSSIRANTGTRAGCAEGQQAGAVPGRLDIPAYTPNQYLHAYRYDRLHRRKLRGQGERIAVIEIDGFKRSDVETFGRCFGFRVPPTPITRVGIKKPLPPGDETTLDLEVLAAAAPGLREIQVMETNGTNVALIRAYAKVLNRPRGRRASVISASLGQCEPSFGGGVGVVRLFEQVFRAAAAAGVSNFASTGDVGSTGCVVGDNSGALPLLAVQHPASSPYVTAVGGTNLVLNPKNRIIDELAWGDAPLAFGGGTGGQSLLFERPAWQRGPGVGQGTQRVVPDVAMLADPIPGYAIYCSNADCDNAGWTAVGGTSAATPLFAAGVAIANQQARRARTPRLGFVSPLIYRLAKRGSRRPVFRDVRKGSNDLGVMIPNPSGGPSVPIGCCPATRNHDMATGWGSVFLPAFSRAARREAKADARRRGGGKGR